MVIDIIISPPSLESYTACESCSVRFVVAMKKRARGWVRA